MIEVNLLPGGKKRAARRPTFSLKLPTVEGAPRDPWVLATVGVVLGGVALVSGIVPAWRAARTDPVEAMKGE